MLSTILILLGGLALFLYGMKIMSEGLQSATGEGLKSILWKSTDNRFKGVLAGFTITALIQSSGATTVMLVSFAGAGFINLMQAAGIVLGANIGTTVTGWIVAIAGFRFNIGIFTMPAVAAGFFLTFFFNGKIKYWGQFLLGFGIMFMGLGIMNKAADYLKDSPQITGFLHEHAAAGLLTALAVLLAGVLVTIIIRSSGAAVAITMVLAVNGLADFYTACILVLGANIGTTITANIAAMGAAAGAKRTARLHLLFNLFGVLWVFALVKPVLIPLIDFIIPGDPLSGNIPVWPAVIAEHIAAFHSGFNIINAAVFLPFLKLLAKTAELLVPDDRIQDEPRLRYMSTGLVSVPAISLSQAKLEVERMMEIVIEMYRTVMDVFSNPEKKMNGTLQRIEVLENQIDTMEVEISEFLVRLSRNPLSKENSSEISTMLNKVDQLESIADQCEALLQLIKRMTDKQLKFSDEGRAEILEISGKAAEFLYLISRHIGSIHSNIMADAEAIESRINELRSEFRKGHMLRLNEDKCDIDQGIVFLDMLTRFEKIGDLSYNIAETISGQRIF